MKKQRPQRNHFYNRYLALREKNKLITLSTPRWFDDFVILELFHRIAPDDTDAYINLQTYLIKHGYKNRKTSTFKGGI